MNGRGLRVADRLKGDSHPDVISIVKSLRSQLWPRRGSERGVCPTGRISVKEKERRCRRDVVAGSFLGCLLGIGKLGRHAS